MLRLREAGSLMREMRAGVSMLLRAFLPSIAILGFVLTCPLASADATNENPESSKNLEVVTVYSTPLGGFEMPIDRVPGNVQRSTAKDVESVRRAGLAQFLDQRVGSVSI